jgi:hypothetical protein
VRGHVTRIFVTSRCALLWSCVTRSRNRFYVYAFLVVRDLWLRFELRNLQPQFVFRFCDFLDVNLQDLFGSFFAEERFLIPENGTYRPRPREGLGRTPELGRLPILRTSVDLPETADFREQYFLRGCYTISKATTTTTTTA